MIPVVLAIGDQIVEAYSRVDQVMLLYIVHNYKIVFM